MSTYGLWQKKNKKGNLYLYGKTEDKIIILYKNYYRTKCKQPHYKIKFIEYSQIKSEDLRQALNEIDFDSINFEENENYE